jgi:glycosyltransferase involved in cell wall biosynthesis
MPQNIVVIIPAYNEEKSIGEVIKQLPPDWIREVVVVNNASTDQTAWHAKVAGATVIDETRAGYGSACLAGIAYVNTLLPAPKIVVFVDGDLSDYPSDLPDLVKPILEHGMDFVVGSRALGKRAAGSMTPQQIFGNWLAVNMMWRLYKIKYTDLGPFRAIRWSSLLMLNMQDKTYGWTVEMQLKAAKFKLKTTEVAVRYRRRIGVSKISGTIKGTVLAGYKIITTILKYH